MLTSWIVSLQVKLMMMNVISRVIGVHKLLLLNFYPYLQRYVQPHQRDVTHLLAAAVQSCHEQVIIGNRFLCFTALWCDVARIISYRRLL
jgi:hypothetical protein